MKMTRVDSVPVFALGGRLSKLLAFVGVMASCLAIDLRAATSAIETVTPSILRADWDDYVGFRFTTGSTPLVVEQVGRWIVSDPPNSSTQTHNVRIVDPNNGYAVVASKDVDANLGTPGQFLYVNLDSPVTLQANHTYFLLSREYLGGDKWFQGGATLTTTGDITIDNPEYMLSGFYYSNNDFGTANHSFGAVSFNYTLGGATADAITGAAVGKVRYNFTGDVGFKFSTGDKELTVRELGRWVVSAVSDSGHTHTVKIIDPANPSVPVASTPVNISGAPAGQFKYASISPAVTLSANYTYYLLSSETVDQDTWYENNTGLIPSSEITVTNPVYFDSTYHDEVSNGSTNHGYGPVNFRYDRPSVVAEVTPTNGIRKDWGNYIGFKFTTGPSPLIVTHLGRYKLDGNIQSHPQKIVDPSASYATIASATVNTSGATDDQFAYASLDESVTLSPNHTYFLMTLEYYDGDTWVDSSCAVTPASTTDLAIVKPVFQNANGYEEDGANGANHSYGPVSFLYTVARPSWTFQTGDTMLNLSVYGAPVITSLTENSTKGWDWVASPSVVPLPRSVIFNNNHFVPNWVFSSYDEDNITGKKVTLTYTSTTNNLTLTQVWWASPGVGPVEQTTTISNNSGGEIAFDHADVIPADLTVSPDGAATVWRFNRGSDNGSGDPNFDAGVFQEVMASSTAVDSIVSNDFGSGPYVLPFTMLNVLDVSERSHGLYIGYDRSFGKFKTSTDGNPNVIRNQFRLGDSGSFSMDNATSVILPGMFYGAYVGDTDDGSNKMKKWFWDYKIPSTLRNPSNEPLVTLNADLFSEPDTNLFFFEYPGLAGYGVELMKMDKDWASDADAGGAQLYGWEWNARHTPVDYWPNGFTLPTLVYDQGMQLELYMANTYLGADLATPCGVLAEKVALERRFLGDSVSFGEQDFKTNGGNGFDYWRSDVNSERTLDYLSHLGLLQVLDYMITNYAEDGFRWENCSGGGSKKSFDLLQRQTTGSAEDSGVRAGSMESFRITFYANSYMINAVQLQAQNTEFTENTPALGKYMFRTGMLSAWMHYMTKRFLDTGNPTFNDTMYLGEAVPMYQDYQRPILRGANVYHILPVPDRIHWDGIQYFNPTLNKGSVFLFKPKSSVGNSPPFYLKGLVPSATYTLTYEDRPYLNRSASGSDLMNPCLGIAAFTGAANAYDSEIIWINK